MISGYWCKLRQVPLKVLPFCRVPVKFIGYLTRPLGFFFVSVDTEKVANRRQRRCHAAQNGSGVLPSQSFAAFRDYSLLWRSENILSSAFSAVGIAHFIESTDDLYCSPDGSICRVIYITRNMLTFSSSFSLSFL